MATTKVWNLQYVVGNPKMFSKVITSADSPMTKTKALEEAHRMVDNIKDWRIWVVHERTGERIFESPVEVHYQKNFL